LRFAIFNDISLTYQKKKKLRTKQPTTQPPKHTNLHHVFLAFPTPRWTFSITIIDVGASYKASNI